MGAGAAATVSHFRTKSREAHFWAVRTAGLAAAAAGDDAGTVAALAAYVAAHENDEAATVAYAVARSHQATVSNLALRDAMRLLESFADRHPEAAQVRRALLTMLPNTGDAALLERLADESLRANPADPAAWRARATVRLWQDRRADAVDAAAHAAALVPDDLDMRLDVLRLMDHAGRPAGDLLKYAEGEFAATDARRLILRATALRAGGDMAGARVTLRAAVPLATRTPVRPATVLALVSALDAVNDSPAARALLRDAVAARPDALPLARAYAWRCWQAGDVRPLLCGWRGFDPASNVADPELLAARAIALFEAGHSGDGQDVVRRLPTGRDRVAATWAAALTTRFVAPPPTPARLAAAYAKCLAKDPQNATVHAWAAETYAAAGEPSLALDHWTAAGEAAPLWARPHAGRAAALVALNRLDDAVDAAQSAYTRSPTLAAAADVVAVRYARFGQTGDAAEAPRLLAAVEAVQATSPGEPATLAVRVGVLARTNRRDEAADALQQALRTATTPDAVARLSAVDRAECLGVTDPAAASSRTSALGLSSPAVTSEDASVRRAALLASAGASGRPEAVAWRLAEARQADAANAPDARTAFDGLLNDFPDRPDVALAFADAACTRRDRPARLAAIVHLQDLLGDDALQWKVARAHWLADGDDPAGWSDAVTLLSDVVRTSPRELPPRLELACVLAKAGSAGTAIEHLRVAREAAPHAAEPLAALAGLLMDQGRGADALAMVRQAANAPMMGWAERRFLARYAAGLGDAETTLKLLAVDRLPAEDATLQAICLTGTRQGVQTATTLSPVSPRAVAPAVGLAEAVARLAADPARADRATQWADVVHAADLWPAVREMAQRVPSDLALQTLVVETALGRREMDTALDAARGAVAARPADARALRLLTRATRPTGRWADVRVAAERWARAAQPDFAEADVALAEALLRTGSPAAAVERARPYAGRADGASVLAEALVDTGQADAALTVLTSCDDGIDCRRTAWRLACRMATPGAADQWLNAFAASDADALPLLHARAAVARRFGDAALATRTLADATALAASRPADADVRLVQAGLLEQLGRTAEATRVLTDGLARTPGNAAMLNDLACLLLTSDPILSRRHAARAVALAPETATFHDTLARACAAGGDGTEARTQFRAALAIDPQCDFARDGLRRLTAELPTASAGD